MIMENLFQILLQITKSHAAQYILKKENQNSNTNKKNEVSLKNFRALEKEVARLEGIVEILQGIDCTANSLFLLSSLI